MIQRHFLLCQNTFPAFTVSSFCVYFGICFVNKCIFISSPAACVLSLARFISMKFKAVTFINSSFLNCYFEDVSSVGSSFNNCTFVDSFFYNTGECAKLRRRAFFPAVRTLRCFLPPQKIPLRRRCRAHKSHSVSL